MLPLAFVEQNMPSAACAAKHFYEAGPLCCWKVYLIILFPLWLFQMIQEYKDVGIEVFLGECKRKWCFINSVELFFFPPFLGPSWRESGRCFMGQADESWWGPRCPWIRRQFSAGLLFPAMAVMLVLHYCWVSRSEKGSRLSNYHQKYSRMQL